MNLAFRDTDREEVKRLMETHNLTRRGARDVIIGRKMLKDLAHADNFHHVKHVVRELIKILLPDPEEKEQ